MVSIKPLLTLGLLSSVIIARFMNPLQCFKLDIYDLLQ